MRREIKIITFYTEDFKSVKGKQNLQNFYIPHLISTCVYVRMYVYINIYAYLKSKEIELLISLLIAVRL